MHDVEAVVEVVELLAAGIVVEHFGQRTLAAVEQLERGGIGGIDLVGQWFLLGGQQAAQAFVVDANPDGPGGREAGFQALQRGLAAPGVRLEGLRDTLALTPHRRTEFFLQGVQCRHLRA
ncbi:hypothetical protein D3C84_399920 [compost metagenome]